MGLDHPGYSTALDRTLVRGLRANVQGLMKPQRRAGLLVETADQPPGYKGDYTYQPHGLEEEDQECHGAVKVT